VKLAEQHEHHILNGPRQFFQLRTKSIVM